MAPKKKVEEVKKVKFGRPGNTLRMGLVGLPNVGKSTTFNVLTKCSIPAENFPFCTIDPHEAVVNVPDERMDWLSATFKPKNTIAAVLRIWDIAGLVPNAHEGEGLGNAFLSNIQSVDGIYHVCRAFTDEDIVHTEGEVNPVRDLEIIQNELIFKDLAQATNRAAEYAKKAEQNKKMKELQEEYEALTKCQKILESGKPLRLNADWTSKEVEIVNKYQFLTTKPTVYLVNMSEKDFIRQKNKWLPKIKEWVDANGGGPIIPYSAAFEMDYQECGDSEEDKKAFLEKTGAKKSMIDKIIKTGYDYLDLIHFFTCGPDEVRCWTIQRGTKAPQAAGVIHTDMERGFICAETYRYEDIRELGDESAVKAAGKLHQNGKNYEVQDGDICFFKFNVTNKGKSQKLSSLLEEYERSVDVRAALSYVCCRDITVPLEVPLAEDTDKVLCLGANMVETPVYAAQIISKRLEQSSARPLILIISGGIGRLTPLLCDNVIAWSKKEDLVDLATNLTRGEVPYQSKLKGLTETEKLEPVREEDAIRFSRDGYKSRDDLEGFLTEGNLYLEVILAVLIEKQKIIGYSDIRLLDRHNAASFDKKSFCGKLVIILENTSTNTGNNVTHTKELLGEANLLSPETRMAVVDIPYLGRRALATLAWHFGPLVAGYEARMPPVLLNYPEDFPTLPDRVLGVHMAAGELIRMAKYSRGTAKQRFFDIPEDFPRAIYQQVVEAEPLLNEMRRILGERIPA
ncbi:Obg-like ATPase [Perkinsus chesapeaki]|uniref:Obg-like ATPase 1 n=1 Tax=Perkinsus chesapeaki TaxID=330153 RepID=A0A7J6LTC0_PERCH|nr:Obg-like ATPase [Perkinsus chesapeaki]